MQKQFATLILMKLRTYIFILFSLSLFFCSFRNNPDLNPVKLLGQMYDSIKSIKTLRVKILALERIEKKYVTAHSEIKLQTSPRRLYFLNPDKKLEILYNEGQLNNRAMVKPHVFPYFTLTLDPTGNVMRKNQHYTIHELGFDFIGKSVALTINKDKDGLKNFIYRGKVNRNGYRCHMIEYENKSYSYADYTVGEKETASTIAYKLCVNDYLLRYKNNLVNDFGYLKKGSVIKVPTLYCKKAILFLDEKTLLPVSISLYDDVGIFENYEFSGAEVNKPIRDEEFSKDYKDYHF
jgi:hypothetical protein